MPNISKITLPHSLITDLTADEVYNVVARDGSKTTLRHVGDGQMANASRIIVNVRQPNANSKYYVVTVAVVKPELVQDENGKNSTILNRFNGEWRLDKSTSIAQVTSLHERVKAFLADNDVNTVITEAENLY